MKSIARLVAAVLMFGFRRGLVNWRRTTPKSIKIGSFTITPPTGWMEIEHGEERVALCAPNSDQQATISILCFGVEPTFADFKKLCDIRIIAEKQSNDCVVRFVAPFENFGKFGMRFSGDEKSANRIFSGSLTLDEKELLTVYLEGMGVSATDHGETFTALLAGIHRK